MSQTARVCAIIAAIPLLFPIAVRAHTDPNVIEVTWEALPCVGLCRWNTAEGGFPACEAPFPPWGFDDVVTAPAPAAPPGMITVLEATIDPAIDWDLWICADNPSSAELAVGANIIGEPCQNTVGPNSVVPVGCHEDASTPLREGQTVVLRAFNFLDIPRATGRYWFTFAGPPR